jgi:hypothetical protein
MDGGVDASELESGGFNASLSLVLAGDYNLFSL